MATLHALIITALLAMACAGCAVDEAPLSPAELVAAADAGDVHAELQRGLIYDAGRSVPRYNVLALSWYRKAAPHGNSLAQANLGFKLRRKLPPTI